MKKALIAGIALILAVGVAPAAAAPRIRIPQQPSDQQVATYIGHPALATQVAAPAVPRNPSMSRNPWAAIHNDPYASDTYRTRGPLGRNPVVSSTWLAPSTDPATSGGLVVGITFDRTGRMVAGAVQVRGTDAFVQLTLIDPSSLRTLATFDLPKQTNIDPDAFRPAGTYFYQDNLDRTVIGTVDRTIWVVAHDADSFTKVATWDLASVIPADDQIEALQPDFAGRLWFTSKAGVVGTVSLASGAVLGTYRLADGERIVNGHSADPDGGVYIASTKAMYRFDATAAGAPAVTWREEYDAGTRQKPGQVDVGTGTTPTVMGSDYVTITDNADPRMHVLVYRRAKTVTGDRLACAVPVFEAGMSSTENSLVATDRSIVVENNYGYTNPADFATGITSVPGLTRIDVSPTGTCRTAWTNTAVSIPSVVTKLSLATGLIYSYTKAAGAANPWYFTAVSFRTGKVVWQRLAGRGPLYDNDYAPVYLGPNRTLYVGVVGGIVAMRDR